MNPLLILGASTRAAAFSAIRAGFDPICGDMFADADLRAFATVLDLPHYPHKLAEAVEHLPPLPWIYTGALENSPSEVARISQRMMLWGNSSESLKRCRNPWFCRDRLWQAQLPALGICATPPIAPRDRQWLMKPFRSAAGRAIVAWDDEAKVLAEPHYFQEFAAGTSISAAFLGTSESALLLGISEQLIGRSELNAPPFGYCGSIFPWPGGDPKIDALVRQIGSVMSRECGLRGLFGIDLIFDGQAAWLTEVNPRYTASMELLEHYWQVPLLDWHRCACVEDDFEVRLPDIPRTSQGQYCCKVVKYADHAAKALDLTSEIPTSIDLVTLPRLADIPVAGTEIFPGHPVFTCLGTGAQPSILLAELMQRAEEIWSEFPRT